MKRIFFIIMMFFLPFLSFSQVKKDSITEKVFETREDFFYNLGNVKSIETIPRELNVNFENSIENKIYIAVEKSASFPGGQDAMFEFIAVNFQYPEQALHADISGIVFLSFIVERDGSITDIKIVRDIGFGLGEAAIKVVEMMPKWVPAEQNANAVRQLYNLPISINQK